MGQLSDKLAARIADIQSAIKVENTRHSVAITTLQASLDALNKTAPLISKELETAVDTLQRLGFLSNI